MAVTSNTRWISQRNDMVASYYDHITCRSCFRSPILLLSPAEIRRWLFLVSPLWEAFGAGRARSDGYSKAGYLNAPCP